MVACWTLRIVGPQDRGAGSFLWTQATQLGSTMMHEKVNSG